MTTSTTHKLQIILSAASTRSQAKRKTHIRNTTDAITFKWSFAQVLASTVLPLSPFANATRATSEPPGGMRRPQHRTADPLIKLVVVDSHKYLAAVSTRHMPSHNPGHPASVAAARLRVTHATMYFTACPETTCITDEYYNTNSQWCYTDMSFAY